MIIPPVKITNLPKKRFYRDHKYLRIPSEPCLQWHLVAVRENSHFTSGRKGGRGPVNWQQMLTVNRGLREIYEIMSPDMKNTIFLKLR